MKFLRFILIGLFILLSNYKSNACVCTTQGFCESLNDSSIVFEARVIQVRQINSFGRFVDIVITGFLRKTDTTTYDTLSVTNGPPTCDGLYLFSHEIGGSFVFQIAKEGLTRDSSLKYPTFSLFSCSTPILEIKGNSISGLFVNTGFVQDHQTLAYDAFKGNMDESCELLQTTLSLELLETNLNIFPNPVQNTLTLENASTQDFAYVIYSNLGKIVASGISNQQSKFSIDMSSFPLGIYYLQIRIREIYFHKKIVKI